MSEDREFVDRIKKHFARKSSAQLQEIVQTGDRERWSVEAIAAAGEVLRDRSEGLAEEPLEVEEEPSPPSSGHDVDSVALMAGLSVLTFPLGFVVLPVNRYRKEDPVAKDQPVPFGSEIAWLAVDTADTATVATILDLRGAREATWEEGIEAAYRSSVFVTPPVGDWTLAASTALFPPNRVDEFVKPLLERLSRQFGDAQYFCTHRDVGLHIWARAHNGRLVRGYGSLGQKGLTLWDEGSPTKEERDLGFRFLGRQSPAVEQGQNKEVMLPGEEDVMLLASYWSIDPTTLDEQFKEPLTGILGDAAKAVGDPGAAADRPSG
jgi:hypothetical protein